MRSRPDKAHTRGLATGTATGQLSPVTLWEGRLGEPAANAMAPVTRACLSTNGSRPYDIAASRAHVRGLARGGILTDEEAATLAAALDRVGEEIESGAFVFKAGDEDIHTALERRVTEIAGDTGPQAPYGAQPQRPGRDEPAALDP